MKQTPDDTIAAVATPAGRGGVAIIRVSGREVRDIAEAVLGFLPEPRHAGHVKFLDENRSTLDDGIALFFPAPNSFTGEDVLELHGHGGSVIADMLLARVLSLGARHANPGEFSQRAFINDKLDLAQAEAIADLIDSGSQQAAKAAMRSLQGEFSALITELAEAITSLRTHVEAAIDFPDEEIDFLADETIATNLGHILRRIGELKRNAQQGCLLQEGINVVIAGKPNAGKSSLLNRLAGYEAAIVTTVPGTTRDVLKERITIDGLPLHVLDTAGLREVDNIVEQEGVRRARSAIESADRVLLVVDSTEESKGPDDTTDFGEVPVTEIRNKIDLSGDHPGAEDDADPPVIRLSAKTGEGIEVLRQHLKDCVGYQAVDSGLLSARRRHLDALDKAAAHMREADKQLREFKAGELVAEELRLAHQALMEITGEFTTEDLLGRIFSTFCIGK
ncbi:MAG: tRNA uridine-5-carboxymethylaminomethyl(34) synthesis GTPase MnmE [Gammaproteobacteria bacterium]